MVFNFDVRAIWRSAPSFPRKWRPWCESIISLR